MSTPNRNRSASRVVLIVAVVIAALAVLALGGLYALQREARARVEAVLAPIGTASQVHVAFWLTSVELTDVRLKPPPDWPSADMLRAQRITVTPDLRALLSHRVHIREVHVSGFLMTVVRRQNGSIQILPNLRREMEAANAADAASATSAASSPSSTSAPSASTDLASDKLIDHIVLENGSFVFYDRSVSNPPWRVTVSDANARVDHVHLPALDEPTHIVVTGSLKGPAHTGHVSFDGTLRIASKDSQTRTTLRSVDIAMLDPYLLKKAGARANVAGGTLDLDLTATVRGYRLHAPGTVTLHHLQLAESKDPLDSFLSIPTRAAVAALKSHQGDITLHFVLDGDLHDPKFKLDDSLMTELRAGFAQALGVSAQGVAQGAGQTAKGIADALRNLFGASGTK
ncbi:DUF748 domain-containing protein [Paraburkholderia bannensis]|uniref:DUF748 domain-containing protein n=1 Tax=Paraburkholderia bannensis TaxID=765414 RepID=UPI002ABDA2C6|nr:DUF748 domain-containing protein [Paraburkholderia bannensis]